MTNGLRLLALMFKTLEGVLYFFFSLGCIFVLNLSDHSLIVVVLGKKIEVE